MNIAHETDKFARLIFNVLPSRATNELAISFQPLSEEKQYFIEVFDKQENNYIHLSKTIRAEGMQYFELDIRDLNVGEYFVRLKFGDNFLTKEFIKE